MSEEAAISHHPMVDYIYWTINISNLGDKEIMENRAHLIIENSTPRHLPDDLQRRLI